jgi:prepilin-type N-terminal cleavage/methylation domain-containing protein
VVTVRTSQRGFSLAELLISMSIMLVIAGAATTALMKMTGAQATLWNRTQMHSGIRGATEVLQQEVGQAGRIAMPAPVTVTASLGAGSASAQPLTVSSTAGMFVGQKLVVDAGCFDTTVTPCISREETVTVLTVPDATSFTAIFANGHAIGAPVQARGVFATGVIPSAATPSSYPNGSTGDILKLYGDINADGNMVYVEYTCEYGAVVGGVRQPGNLYRNQMDWNDAPPSPDPAASQILLSNIMPNPDNSPCFIYQQAAVLGQYYVIDVAITLTVQTQLIDPVTKQFQLETKALLNVSPRNVFHAWTLASLGIANRIQPIPPTVAALLP